MKESELPLVTVFSLVYNTGPYVIQALESVRANNYPNLQHIIIDDCSKDDSVRLLEDWIAVNNYQCTFIKHTTNAGMCKSLNEVVRLSKGKYILGVSDDLLAPDRIRTHVELFEKGGEQVGVVYGDVNLIDSQNNLLLESYRREQERNGVSPKDGKVYYDLLVNNFVPAPGATVRRTCYEKAGPYNESFLYEDWDMWLRISQHFEFLSSEKIAASYRRHSGSITSNAGNRMYECCLLTIAGNITDDRSKAIASRTLYRYAKLYFLAGGNDAAQYFRLSMKYGFSMRAFCFWLYSSFFGPRLLLTMRKKISFLG